MGPSSLSLFTIRRSRAVVFSVAAVAALGLGACSPNQESSDEKGTTPPVFTSSEPPAGYEAEGEHGAPDEGGHTTEAEGEFVNREGDEVGTVTFVQKEAGIEVTVDVKDLTPGVHGWHVHVTPECEGDFMSSGGHLMRDAVDIGAFPNLQVNQDGVGKMTLTTDQFNWDELENGGEGRAVVIHNGTDPNNRAACALVK